MAKIRWISSRLSILCPYWFSDRDLNGSKTYLSKNTQQQNLEGYHGALLFQELFWKGYSRADTGTSTIGFLGAKNQWMLYRRFTEAGLK